MKKASYEEHRQWALENNIQSRDGWREQAKNKNFPKNLYKSVESSFKTKGEWEGWDNFIKTIHTKQNKFENEQALARIYNFTRDYKNLELGKYDTTEIYNFLASIELIYSRKPPKLSVMAALNSFHKKKYVVSKRLETMKINERKVTYGFHEYLDFKSNKDEEEFLELERIFLIFSCLLNYQREYGTIDIVREKIFDFYNLNDITNFKSDDLYKEYSPYQTDKNKDKSFYNFFNEKQKKFFQHLEIERWSYFEGLDKFKEWGIGGDLDLDDIDISEGQIESIINNNLNELDLEIKLIEISNKFLRKIKEVSKHQESCQAMCIAYFFHIFIDGDFIWVNRKISKPNTFSIFSELVTSTPDLDFFYDDEIKRNPANFEINSKKPYTSSADMVNGNTCLRFLDRIRKDIKDRNNLYKFLTLPIFYESIILPAFLYFEVILNIIPNGKNVFKEINEISAEFESSNQRVEENSQKKVSILLWALQNNFFDLDPFEKVIREFDGKISKDIKINQYTISEDNSLNFSRNPNIESNSDNTVSFQALSTVLNIGSLESLKVVQNNNQSKYIQISKELIGTSENQFKFIYEVNDDSMAPEFQIGDHAVIEKIRLLDLEYGKYYLIKTKTGKSDDFNLRKIMKPGSLKEGYGLLKTLNKDWPEAEIKMNDIEVFGKVIKIIKDLK